MVVKKLSFFALVLLIVSAVDSNRNLPSAAIFGAPLIFFFLFSALFFLFPVSLISAELGTLSERKGGIYHWVRLAFGEKAGVVAIWLQWVQAISWFPTILTFIAGTGAFLIQPELMSNKTYMVFSISIVFWALTLVNLRGIQISAKLNEIFCLIGTLIPTLALIVLGIIWISKGESVAISVSMQSIIPSFSELSPWTALVAIMTSFAGMELAGVHMRSIENPRKAFPRAVILSSFVVLASMMFGALAIALVLPAQSIHLAGGLMQVFAAFFKKFHLDAWIIVVSLMILVGSFGNLINWILAPAKGLLNASEHGYLPSFFAKVNKNGVASRILVIQAVLVTCLCSLFLLLPSVNAVYWFLMATSSSLYTIMYILMFFSAIRLRNTFPRNAFHVPGGNLGLFGICGIGLIGCIITLFVTFVPPPNIQIASPLKYAIMMLCANLFLIFPVFLLFLKKKKS
ncbi:MAG TPA: APC family permease [Chlamydiales bacterium]|nr:APC family permease [Chlamydiales bacterium]